MEAEGKEKVVLVVEVADSREVAHVKSSSPLFFLLSLPLLLTYGLELVLSKPVPH